MIVFDTCSNLPDFISFFTRLEFMGSRNSFFTSSFYFLTCNFLPPNLPSLITLPSVPLIQSLGSSVDCKHCLQPNGTSHKVEYVKKAAVHCSLKINHLLELVTQQTSFDI